MALELGESAPPIYVAPSGLQMALLSSLALLGHLPSQLPEVIVLKGKSDHFIPSALELAMAFWPTVTVPKLQPEVYTWLAIKESLYSDVLSRVWNRTWGSRYVA